MGRRTADHPPSPAPEGRHLVAATTAKGRAVHRLIESGTALLTVHTNGDSAVGGVSDVLADALGLEDVAPLTLAGKRPARKRASGGWATWRTP